MGNLSAKIGQFIGGYFKYQPFFVANDMTNDFSISYRQKAKRRYRTISRPTRSIFKTGSLRTTRFPLIIIMLKDMNFKTYISKDDNKNTMILTNIRAEVPKDQHT